MNAKLRRVFGMLGGDEKTKAILELPNMLLAAGDICDLIEYRKSSDKYVRRLAAILAMKIFVNRHHTAVLADCFLDSLESGDKRADLAKNIFSEGPIKKVAELWESGCGVSQFQALVSVLGAIDELTGIDGLVDCWEDDRKNEDYGMLWSTHGSDSSAALSWNDYLILFGKN